jgi:hypothetical protein
MMDRRVKPGNDDAADISQNATADRLEAGALCQADGR